MPSSNHNDLQTVRKQGSKFLHFTLANTPDDETSCKIEYTNFFNYKPFASFQAADYKIYSESSAKFANTIDKWFATTDEITKSDVVEVAKLAHYLAIKHGSKSVHSVRNIIERRLPIGSGHTTFRCMILLYLAHIIMTIEFVNPPMGPGSRSRKINSFRDEFEDSFLNPKTNIFRTLVKKAYTKDKRELYSLRCKWGYFFSSEALKFIDGQQFWEKQAKEPEIIEVDEITELRYMAMETTEDKRAKSEADKKRLIYWKKRFVMDVGFVLKCRKKYESKTVDEFFATVYRNFPTSEFQTYMEIVKEAFFLASEFGHAAIYKISRFLLATMNNGMEIYEMEKRVIAQLMACTIIHIIIAIESTNSLIVPNAEKYYTKQFNYLQAPAYLEHFIEDDRISNIKYELKYLTAIWTMTTALDYDRVDDCYAYFGESDYMETLFIYLREKIDTVFFEKDKPVTTATTATEKEVVEHVQSREYARSIPVSREEELKQKAETMKRKKKKEDFIKSKTKGLETLFVPDVIVPAPTVIKRKISNNVDEDNKKRKAVPKNITKCSSINNSELLDINGQPFRTSGSKCEKAMEEIRKMLQERNGGKEAPNNTESYQNGVQIINKGTAVKVIDNFQSNDFIDSLLSPTLEDFEIVYENGIAQMKFVHRL